MTREHDPDTAPSLVGRQLGRYTCLRKIGAGGMAVLYLAQRTGAKGFTKRFALKRIKPKYAADVDFTRMFMREAKLSATLDHPNIAQVVDFGQDGHEHFIVMEYVHGPDLRRLIRASPDNILPLDCALSVATRICAALHYAHERRGDDGKTQELVHRDVSATNVLVSVDGAVKLTDFGIAKSFASEGNGTSSSMLVGKPGYMSPEQVRCESLDRRSDVFCIGILLYEMTTGRRCFFGDSVFAVLNATQRAQYVLPSKRNTEYPPALEAIVVRALNAEPNERFSTARALQSALEDFALDHRIRTSDTVLADYVGTLELGLEDPATGAHPSAVSGTSMRESGGTEFMVSGGVQARPVQHTELAPIPVSPGSRGVRVMGLVGAALVLGGVAVIRPWSEVEDSGAVTRSATPPDQVTEPVMDGPERAAVVPAPVEPEPVAFEPEPDVGTTRIESEPKVPRRKKLRRRKPKKKPSRAPTAVDELVPPSRRKG